MGKGSVIESYSGHRFAVNAANLMFYVCKSS